MSILNDTLVNCEWGEWRAEKCSASCGKGFRRVLRSKKVHSSEGGIDCSGSSTYLESCNIRECPGINLIKDIYNLYCLKMI